MLETASSKSLLHSDVYNDSGVAAVDKIVFQTPELKKIIQRQEKQITQLELRFQDLEKANLELSENLKKIKHAGQGWVEVVQVGKA